MTEAGDDHMGWLFTIGYSGIAIDRFLGLLTDRHVDVLCDVRSVPYSRFRPEFARHDLKRHLNGSGIKYAFFGNELGARPKERSVYVRGQAVHSLIAETDLFKTGLDRLKKGVSHHNLALLCSEREPLECHRAVLVCRYLPEIRDQIAHIHADGRVETHVELEDRLVALHNLKPLPLLEEAKSWDIALSEAYDKQSAHIAFTETRAETSKAAPVP
jgi:uncharacterized protein (DUF488 family)